MKRVIIVGASYAGLYATKKFINSKNIEVLVFDKNDFHYIQVESYGFVANKYDIFDVTINVKEYIQNLNRNIIFYKKEIQSFNSDKKEITTSNNEVYSYDYLIIATGSLTNFPLQVPNIQNYSKGIKTLEKASDVRQMFDSIVNKIITKQKDTKNEAFNIVIGGAGLSGVEIAAEMAVFLEKMQMINSTEYLKINIVLVDGMKTVLPNMDEKLISSTFKRLKELDIKMYLGSFIKDVDKSKIFLANEIVIDYDYFIFTGGVKGVTLNSNKTYEVNKLNQYVTDEYLHLKGEEDIFVVGDVAETVYNGKYLAPTAQLAIKAGEYVSTFIQDEIKNKPLNLYKIFNPKLRGTLISLGGEYAVALIFQRIFIKGYLAYLMKKLVTKNHKKSFYDFCHNFVIFFK